MSIGHISVSATVQLRRSGHTRPGEWITDAQLVDCLWESCHASQLDKYMSMPTEHFQQLSIQITIQYPL